MTARFPKYLQLRDLHKALNADAVKKAAARGGAPAWLKDFAGQLEDPEYCALSPADRGFLKDLRLLALRRGNKILNDETYLRGQLRLSPRTQVDPRLHTLREAGFLEPYNEATNPAANSLNRSRANLEPGENDSALEVEVEVEVPLSPPKRGARGSKKNALRFMASVRPVYLADGAGEARVWLEGMTADDAEIDAHLSALIGEAQEEVA